jgi:hypothetical protein
VIICTDECLVQSWLDQHDGLSVKVRDDAKKELQTLENDPKTRYSMFKRNLSRVAKIIYGPDASSLTPVTVKELAQLVITDENFEEQLSRLTTHDAKSSVSAVPPSNLTTQGQPDLASSLDNDTTSSISAVPPSNLTRTESSRMSANASEKSSTLHLIEILQPQDDFAFAIALQSIAEKDEVFNEVVKQFRVLMVELLRQKIKRLSSSILATVKEKLLASIDRDLFQAFKQRKQDAEAAAWQGLKEKVQELLSQAASNTNDW